MEKCKYQDLHLRPIDSESLVGPWDSVSIATFSGDSKNTSKFEETKGAQEEGSDEEE